MSLRMREMCSIDEDELVSGGVYRPPSRKALALDMRSSAEAEGESRIMGSGRRAGFWLSARAALAVRAAACGGAPGLRVMKGAASLRTWEKSCVGALVVSAS